MLSERGQTHTMDHTDHTQCEFLFYDVGEMQIGGSLGWGKEGWGMGSSPAMGVGFLQGDENVLDLDNQIDVVVTQYRECAKYH